MKTSFHKTTIFAMAAIFSFFIVAATSATAADDPTIKGELREDIMNSMKSYIERNLVNGKYYIYDAVEGQLLELKFAKLHDGIVKKGDFYVSCADFVDNNGTKVDLDFLVMENGDNIKTIQAVVHSIDGKKRKYHLEG